MFWTIVSVLLLGFVLGAIAGIVLVTWCYANFRSYRVFLDNLFDELDE